MIVNNIYFEETYKKRDLLEVLKTLKLIKNTRVINNNRKRTYSCFVSPTIEEEKRHIK